MGGKELEKSERFYTNYIAPMIHEKFPKYEKRIACGLVGEGSDCFGYDDYISRDHDFGTGVCLWLTEEDFEEIGNLLSIAYNEIAQQHGGDKLTERLQERRGVMTIKSFYSNILYIDCNVKDCVLSDNEWWNLDHSCLATACNGKVFRDDLGEFTAFRELLMNYYPDKIWKHRIMNEMHIFSSTLQINYARCMSRGDRVAAEICRCKGLEAAMELFFLIQRKYAPYYKWTFKALAKIGLAPDTKHLLEKLACTEISNAAWRLYEYDIHKVNFNDPIVEVTEKVGFRIASLLHELGLVDEVDGYLENLVGEMVLKYNSDEEE